ncbi:MAG: bifunctional DNA primase/polymerase [Terricaulis sp.]|nr:bifunctional DNA primase/polymerase [Terricaulis sp.]
MKNEKEAAQEYIARGWRPIRVEAYGKKPAGKGWKDSEPKPEDFHPGDNIGIDFGRSADLVDVDLDWPTAREIAIHPLLFGAAPAFGREGQTPGHRLVRCSDAPNKKLLQFAFSKAHERPALDALGVKKSMILELRGCGQSVVPPSTLHSPDGEKQRILWQGGATPAQIPEFLWEELNRRAGLTALLATVLQAYPPTGERDNTCLHLAGTLVHLGVQPDDADELVYAVASAAGDEEAQNRRGKARVAASRIASGDPVTGLPRLLSALGIDTLEATLRGWLGASPKLDKETFATADGIDVSNPAVHILVEQFAMLLAEKSQRIYRRGSQLMRPSRLEQPEMQDGVIRNAGLVELRVAEPKWLVHEASRCGGNFGVSTKAGWVRRAPPLQAAIMLSAIADETPFPAVRGLAMTPTLTRDEPGYDPDTQLLLEFPAGMFPPIREKPTKEEAEEALAALEAPIRDFPFVDEAARSVARSAILCSVVRGQLRTCPMHIFDAPTAGSGKSKLADISGIVATGVAPSVVTYSGDQEENEKRLATILRAGDPVIAIDNISHELEGDFLCQMLTQETVQARILGQSERVRMSTRSLVLGTGNNVRFRGDIARRVVVGRIDAKMANPEERTFDFDPVQIVREQRAHLVACALTVLRAYKAAGTPVALPAYGSFEDWSLVRGALVWLGRADPAETRQRATVDNVVMEERAELFAALWQHAGIEHRITVAEMERNDDLARKLVRLTDKPVFNRKSIGHMLAHHRDIPHQGLTLRSKPNNAKVQAWWLSGSPTSELHSASPETQDEIPY